MNGPFVVAQAGSSSSNSAKAPVQIIKIKKPAPGETEIYHASFTGTVKIDLTDIANEKITFYKDQANQSLHILFLEDGKVVSQAIIEPFFDSMGVLSNLVFDVGPGPDLDAQQFSSQFTFSTDQSVVPCGRQRARCRALLSLRRRLSIRSFRPSRGRWRRRKSCRRSCCMKRSGCCLPLRTPPTTLSFSLPDLVVDESFIPALGSFSGPPGVQTFTTGPLRSTSATQ